MKKGYNLKKNKEKSLLIVYFTITLQQIIRMFRTNKEEKFLLMSAGHGRE